jgi:hypothetical protein
MNATASIFDADCMYPVVVKIRWQKILIGRLLDLLSAEPRWGEGDYCEECQAKVFSDSCLLLRNVTSHDRKLHK